MGYIILSQDSHQVLHILYKQSNSVLVLHIVICVGGSKTKSCYIFHKVVRLTWAQQASHLASNCAGLNNFRGKDKLNYPTIN